MKRILGAILRILAYLVVFLLATVAVMGLAKTFLGDWEAGGVSLELLGEGLLTSLGLAFTGLLFWRLARWEGIFSGWPRVTTGLRWFAKGGLTGFLMAGAMLLLTLTLGGATVEFDSGLLGPYVRSLGPLALGLLFAALAEEWLFRGYPLTALAEIAGRGWANLTLSLLFAAAHAGSTGFNTLVAVNIVLGSLVVGALRFTPGGIATAWGFHFAWNFTQVLCGANLSLENLDVPGVVLRGAGSPIVSGGEFGPEAGIGATLATAVTLGLLVRYFRRRGFRDLPIPLGRGGPSVSDRTGRIPE